MDLLYLKGDKDMNIKKNITIELSEDDVKEIIASYLKNEGYVVTSDNVNLSVGSRITGFGMGECKEVYFKAAYVKCLDKSCVKCSHHNWDMPQCKECGPRNNYKYFVGSEI